MRSRVLRANAFNCYIESLDMPLILPYGQAFALTGAVAGEYARVRGITVQIVNADNQILQEANWENFSNYCKLDGLNKKLNFQKLPEDFYGQRDALECSWIAAAAATCADGDFPELSRKCAVEEQAFYDSWRGYEFEKLRTAPGFMSRWEKKNSVFLKESENID